MTTDPVILEAKLSPSRAADFQRCPLLFRLRVIDQLPTAPSAAAVRGTLVHSVLEHLYDLPIHERTELTARDMVEPAWDLHLQRQPGDAVVVADGEREQWIANAQNLIGTYFQMEDPQRLQPAGREQFVQHTLPTGLSIRGFIDRLDVSPEGLVRIVDYKTGKSPNPRFENSNLFQMRFYALVLWRRDGTIPKQLKLLYLGDGRSVIDEPTSADLEAVEDRILNLWDQITEAVRSQTFEPAPSRLCDWCDFQPLCPAFGGEPPALPMVQLP